MSQNLSRCKGVGEGGVEGELAGGLNLTPWRGRGGEVARGGRGVTACKHCAVTLMALSLSLLKMFFLFLFYIRDGLDLLVFFCCCFFIRDMDIFLRIFRIVYSLCVCFPLSQS